MLTEKQVKYIATIPESRKAKITPFDSKSLLVAQEMVEKIKFVVPDLEVNLFGSLALRIAGEKDVDISIYCESAKYYQYFDSLVKIFGKPNRELEHAIKWQFMEKEHNYDINLIDPGADFAKRNARAFDILKNNPALLHEYEELKWQFHGKSYRQYQTAKFEFFNKLLKVNYPN